MAAEKMTKAASDVLAERNRQIAAESWTPGHDDTHASGQLALAAGWYAFNSVYRGSECVGDVSSGESEASKLFAARTGHGAFQWPWDRSWWKPSTPRRDLVKAGALVLAEIERLDRAALGASDD